MTDERPLHVRVAEALGWTEVSERPAFSDSEERVWFGHPLPDFLPWYMRKGEPYKYVQVPRYDNWQDLGPVIERLGMAVYCAGPDASGPRWWWSEIPPTCFGRRRGDTALEAVCDLLLNLHVHGLLADLLKAAP